jgi:DNA-binding NtrC family response regulator
MPHRGGAAETAPGVIRAGPQLDRIRPAGAAPPIHSGTLVLREVGQLSPADQCRLASWLEASGGRMQVISTTTSPLARRVDAGSFLDSLYDRLNVICVDITA